MKSFLAVLVILFSTHEVYAKSSVVPFAAGAEVVASSRSSLTTYTSVEPDRKRIEKITIVSRNAYACPTSFSIDGPVLEANPFDLLETRWLDRIMISRAVKRSCIIVKPGVVSKGSKTRERYHKITINGMYYWVATSAVTFGEREVVDQ
jgi:hypothetical protein